MIWEKENLERLLLKLGRKTRERSKSESKQTGFGASCKKIVGIGNLRLWNL